MDNINILIEKLKQFIEHENRSCSMDFGCMTPEYIFRMFGGRFSIEEIENGLAEVKKQGFMNL